MAELQDDTAITASLIRDLLRDQHADLGRVSQFLAGVRGMIRE